jgi:hypothetical protein
MMSESGGGVLGDKEWVARTTWDGKELIFVREHSCYDLESNTLRDMAERRIRQCEYELKHWQDLLEKRDNLIRERDKD